jgi:hypothetical protein
LVLIHDKFFYTDNLEFEYKGKKMIVRKGENENSFTSFYINDIEILQINCSVNPCIVRDSNITMKNGITYWDFNFKSEEINSVLHFS